jgi:hypothetical protein
MARSIHRLSTVRVNNAKPGKRRDGTPRARVYADGGGLYLQVTPGSGRTSKSWIYRYASATGKERFMGLGSLDTVSLADARERATECRRLRWQKIKDAHTAGKKKLQRRLTVQYQQSRDAQVLALLEACHALRPSRRPSRKRLASIAEVLNPWQPSDEPVRVNIKPKPNGDHRVVMDFGIRQRARQYLVASVLKAVADLHPDQYLTRGGVPAAIDRVTALLHEGYRWTFDIDIKNCYPSFTGTNLEQFIPVQKEVIANVIMATHLTVTPDHSLLYHFGPGIAGEDDPGDPVAFKEALSNARRGIPQGSAVASIAVEMLLAEPLKSLGGEARVVCYADNMLVMAKSEEDAVSITKVLWSALLAHPAGHLKPKLISLSTPGQPFEFLGHQITWGKTSVSIVPSAENEAKFASRFKKDLAAIRKPEYSSPKRNIIASDLRVYVDSWTASFSRCAGMANRKKTCLGQLQDALALAQKGGTKKNREPLLPKWTEQFPFVKFTWVRFPHMLAPDVHLSLGDRHIRG